MGVGLVFWGVAEPIMHLNDPDQGNLIVTTIVTSTIVFEVFGPYLTLRVLRQNY